MMNCPQCRAEAPDESRFCPQCGSPMPPPARRAGEAPAAESVPAGWESEPVSSAAVGSGAAIRTDQGGGSATAVAQRPGGGDARAPATRFRRAGMDRPQMVPLGEFGKPKPPPAPPPPNWTRRAVVTSVSVAVASVLGYLGYLAGQTGIQFYSGGNQLRARDVCPTCTGEERVRR